MFFSLNKKFIYTIAIFFIFTAVLFVYTFYIVYGSKIQEEQKSTILRNQQYLELLYENINLRKDLSRLIRAGHEDLFSKENLNVIRGNNNLEEKQAELSREQQRTAQIVQNYDERYQAITEGIRLVMASSFLIILSMLLIWYLMQRLVLAPINKLAAVSRLVSSGNYDSRVNMNDRRLFQDELDDLSHTFNQMLDNIQSSIRQIKIRKPFYNQSSTAFRTVYASSTKTATSSSPIRNITAKSAAAKTASDKNASLRHKKETASARQARLPARSAKS